MANPPFNVNGVDREKIKSDRAHYPFGVPSVDIEGRKIDLRTPNELSIYFRDRVMAEAVVQYVK
jgi:hypothetical protein